MVGLLAGTVGVIVAAALGYQLVSLISIVIHWSAIGIAIFSGAYIFWELIRGDYLDQVFDTEVVGTVFAGAVSAVGGFVLFKLLEALLATAGLVAVIVIGGMIVLAVFTSPAYIAGGIATSLGILSDALDIFGGDS